MEKEIIEIYLKIFVKTCKSVHLLCIKHPMLHFNKTSNIRGTFTVVLFYPWTFVHWLIGERKNTLYLDGRDKTVQDGRISMDGRCVVVLIPPMM